MIRYAIRRLSDGAWSSVTFEFRTTATYYAIAVLNLSPQEFTIDPV